MISWGARRRIIYFFVTLLVLGVALAGLYLFYKPASSCFDGKQNQDELGIDCGGSCAQVCSTEIQEVREVWTRVFKVDDGKFDTATLLENPNPRHGVKVLPYSVRVLDKDNILISVRSGSTFLNPKEQFVVFNSRLEVGQRTPVRANFGIADTPLWQRIDQAMPKLTIINKGFSNLPRPKLSATITNESLQSISNIEVVAVASDIDQNAIAVSSTIVEELEPGATKELSFSWPKPLAEEPVSIAFYPHFDLSKLK